MSKSLKNISVVAGATLASRVLGLVREMLTAAVFGTSALASAFSTAFQLPNLFRRLLAEGGMTAAFVPTLNDELEKRRREGAFILVSQVSSWLLVTTLAVTSVSILLLSQAEGIARVGRLAGADGDTVERWQLAARLAVILFPYLIFVCLAAVFSGALQSLNRFLEPALSPIWLNVAMIGTLWAALSWTDGPALGKMYWFCGGVLVGGFFQMAVPAWALRREGWRPRFDLTWSEPVRAITRLMGPTIFGSSVYLINMVVSRFIGLSLNDAAVSILNYATRLMELPIGVFAIAVSTVIFPLISRYASQGDDVNFGAAYRKGMRLILLINIPAAVGLAVLAEPIIRVIFEHGAFERSDTHSMMPVLAVFAVGLPLFSFVSLVLRAFYAHKDTATPVRAAVLSFVVNVALSLLLMDGLSTVGLALASTAAIGAQAAYLQFRLVRKGEHFALRHLWADVAKIAVASAVMGAVVFTGWRIWRAAVSVSLMHDVLGVAGLIGAGVSVYAALVWLLKVEGRAEVDALVKKFRAKLGGKGAPGAE